MPETEVACLDADWVLPRISLVWNWKSLVSNRWKVPNLFPPYPSSFPVRVCRISGWLLVVFYSFSLLSFPFTRTAVQPSSLDSSLPDSVCLTEGGRLSVFRHDCCCCCCRCPIEHIQVDLIYLLTQREKKCSFSSFWWRWPGSTLFLVAFLSFNNRVVLFYSYYYLLESLLQTLKWKSASTNGCIIAFSFFRFTKVNLLLLRTFCFVTFFRLLLLPTVFVKR